MKRRSSRLSGRPKVAFIVEGNEGKWLVEALARKVVARLHLEEPPCFETVRLFGAPHIMGILSIVLLLSERDYQPIIVVFDTHTRNRQRIADLLQEIQLPLIRAGVSERVLLVPAIPSIASWVFADEKALERVAGAHLPEGSSRARGRPEVLLRKLLGDWSDREQKRVARYLDPERMHGGDKSFDAFVRALRLALGAGHPPVSEEREPAVT
ncbi:MAG TPA: hypothetical protein VFZ09_43590 [Archangium sp.]|uniref:hypothetical protein n=1 Tax=Archangium sp. TaxID=1872627 RepID=UPI002E30766C|nr:hypothetical protein [Archangium sp.]HEX5753164.1 hypothetical protein [Archangium sp.]